MPGDRAESAGRWGLRDLAIVIAGLASGMALARAYYREAISIRYVDFALIGGLTHRQWGVAVVMALAPIAAMLVVLRLTRPGASWRRATREPGFVAALATCLLAMIVAVEVLISRALPPLPHIRKINDPNVLSNIGFSLVCTLGPAILAIWLIQAIGGRCRLRPTLIDRAGRALGVAWPLLGLADASFRLYL